MNALIRTTVSATFAVATGLLFADETPDKFTWAGGSPGTWFTGTWTPTSTSRTAPGILGDTASITNATTMTLDSNATISGLNITSSTLKGGTDPVTLTFGSADGTSMANFNYYKTCLFGAASDNTLTLQLTSPVRIYGALGGANTNRGVHREKITGGTAANPQRILFAKNEASYNKCYHYLVNAANDFRGDIEMRGVVNQDDCPHRVCLGIGDVTAVDSMLGDPANEIYFSFMIPTWRADNGDYKENDIFLNQVGATGFNRKIHGNGAVYGKKIKSDYSESAAALVLGNGFYSDPSIRKETAEKTKYGKQTFGGTTITILPGATFCLDVDINNNKTNCDSIVFSPTAAFAFTGAVVVREGRDLPIGTTLKVGRIAAAAGSVSVTPSSITAGWEMMASGNSTAGWDILLLKASLAPTVQSAAVCERGPAEATLTANVLSFGSASSGELRFYYGSTDGAGNVDAWTNSVSYGMISSIGQYELHVTNLVSGTVYFRPAVVVGDTVTFSQESASFSTVADSTPATFLWRTADPDTFDSTSAWVRATRDYARKLPGYAGDTIRFDLAGGYGQPGGSNAVVNITSDATVGNVYITGGYERHVYLYPASGTTLTLDNLGATSSIRAANELQNLTIGSASVSSELALKNSLDIIRDGTYGGGVNLYSKITGGTAENPCNIRVISNGNQWSNYSVYFQNANNDFVGDISVRKDYEGACTLFVGGSNSPAQDSMLGNVSNTVTLYKGGVLKYYGTSSLSPTVDRKVFGTGTLTACYYYDPWQSPDQGLKLGENAVLSPGPADGSAYGTLTVSVPTLEDTAKTKYAFHINAADTNVCDKLKFSVKSGFDLLGMFEVTPVGDTRIRAGQRWAIGSVSTNAVGFAVGRHKSKGDFRVYTEDNGTSAWTIYAEKKSFGLQVYLR